tara:strand:+ start:40 stop:633 length:594 start_codon:yes stop_codon:yes gene_type:complete
MARSKNGLPIFIKEFDRWAASAAFTGPINAAQKTVDELQQAGPIWTGEYANSWVIKGAGKTASGTKKPGPPQQIKLPKPSGQAISRAVLGKKQIVYNLTNVAEHRAYAEDEIVGRFRRFTPTPLAEGNKWVQTDSGRKEGELLRPDIGGGSEKGVSSRTADPDWLTTFKKGGQLDKIIKIEINKAIQQVKKQSKGFK